jgi:uncharacterized coiled-coil protein SlyX
MTNYKWQITNHESRITNHESRIKNQESRIKNQESRIKNQESRIKNHESRITNQESRIKNQESRIKNQESRIKNQESRITKKHKFETPETNTTNRHWRRLKFAHWWSWIKIWEEVGISYVYVRQLEITLLGLRPWRYHVAQWIHFIARW